MSSAKAFWRTGADAPLRTPSGLRPVYIALRVIALIAIVVAATWAAHLIRDALNLTIMPASEQQVHRIIMLGALAHIGLLALPFVPGAEIGIAMPTTFGSAIAPLVYACYLAPDRTTRPATAKQERTALKPAAKVRVPPSLPDAAWAR